MPAPKQRGRGRGRGRGAAKSTTTAAAGKRSHGMIAELAATYWPPTDSDATAIDDDWSGSDNSSGEEDMEVEMPTTVLFKMPFDDALVQHLYAYAGRHAQQLEHHQYLERYVWPNYSVDSASDEHVLSVVLMLNEKHRQRVPVWQALEADKAKFSAFFKRAVSLSLARHGRSLLERERLLLFLSIAFQSLEHPLVRSECMRLVSVGVWRTLASKARQEKELAKVPPMVRKLWRAQEKRFKAAAEEHERQAMQLEWHWLSWLTVDLLETLNTISTDDANDSTAATAYCERALALSIELLSQLPTRRFVNTLLDDHHLVLLCRRAPILLDADTTERSTLAQLVDSLDFYADFEVDDHTGRSLNSEEHIERHTERLLDLQQVAYSQFKEVLGDLALSHLAAVETPDILRQHLSLLGHDDLLRLCDAVKVRRVPVTDSNKADVYDDAFLVDALVYRYRRRNSQLQQINDTSLYPDEKLLFDEILERTAQYKGDVVLPLPRLNLQFLTLHDYLLRAFQLFRLESAYEIRQDIEDAVRRLAPQRTFPDGTTVFTGWTRMAMPIEGVQVTTVDAPLLGEVRPSRVCAQLQLHVGQFTEGVRREWESLKPFDNLFLLTVVARDWTQQVWDPQERTFQEHYGIVRVRGCEILNIGDNAPNAPARQSHHRTLRILLDPNQYYEDQQQKEVADVGATFNVVLRRSTKENNFKAVLETVRDLMQSELVVPDWLHQVFLGYGDPESAHYRRIPQASAKVDFRDTFLNAEHLQASFPKSKLLPAEGNELPQQPPYVIETVTSADQAEEELRVSTYQPLNMGPYPVDIARKNAVPFTPTQVEAIRAGTHAGLTLIVGPPGTGKTDVAVQIIANLYHNFPQQRILLVARSNQALNQLFEKIVALDIDARHLLRLGHGEEALATEESFNKAGRVESFLERRIELLREVSRLAASLGLSGAHGYTCETASYFFLYHVLSRWEPFEATLDGAEGDDTVARLAERFPFATYFANAPQPLFHVDGDRATAVEVARGCFRHLKRMFDTLEEIRAFELLRTAKDRANYLLTKEARIVAMTTTHAALKRRDLVQLKFKYDTVIMEEAAQVLEGETFIPMLLQEPQDGRDRLKRVVLIGDHHQLPPVVQNPAFEKYCNLEQSMFARLVRLGVPTITLDQQGRCRSSLAELYRWRYPQLGDLPTLQQQPAYQLANPGFAYEYQFINVEDHEGCGETAPSPHFYQNLGEAEYIVAIYQYMRLLGYPANKIAILTTYNGQRALIQDVLSVRCAEPLYGMPGQVTTVDKYQGQQNDYVLLSLVRTRHVGHLRDVRRLVVALSRARLGLYIVGRMRLFASCPELAPTFRMLRERPLQLSICEQERFGAQRKVSTLGDSVVEVADLTALQSRVKQLHAQSGSTAMDTDVDMDALQAAAEAEVQAIEGQA